MVCLFRMLCCVCVCDLFSVFVWLVRDLLCGVVWFVSALLIDCVCRYVFVQFVCVGLYDIV